MGVWCVLLFWVVLNLCFTEALEMGALRIHSATKKLMTTP
jgi:hypothetical protein